MTGVNDPNEISLRLQALEYARPAPLPPRPAMYRLLLTILFGGCMILLGLGATGVFVILLFNRAYLLLIVPFAFAAAFYYMGLRSITVVVRFLMGKRPGKRWENWVFKIG